MADNTTSWVLDFVDMVTAPVKKMMTWIKEASSSFGNMGDASGKSQKDIQVDIEKTKSELKGLKKELSTTEKLYSDLNYTWQQMSEVSRKSLEPALDDQKKKIEELKTKIAEATVELKNYNKSLKGSDKTEGGWAKTVVLVNQFSEIIKKVTDSLDFAVDYKGQEKEIQRLTDLTGDALTEYTTKSREIADVYNQDAVEVAKSVNAMTKQFGGSFAENFTLLEEGFKRGADLSGNLLSNMERYSGAFAEMGISASDAMVIMAKAEKEGISGDKAIESIKKAGDAITELGPRQKKALEDIGVGVEELAGKTKWEAIRMVSESMKGMTEQAKQNVLAGVFGEAGKESGLAFVQNLAEEIPDLSTLKPVEESAVGFKRFFSNVKSWAGDAFGNFGIYATQMAPMVQTIAGAIPILDIVRKSTILTTVATKAWTFSIGVLGKTFLALPIIGWIAAIITVLIIAWNKFEGFRKAVFQAWEVLKLLGNVIKDYVINRIRDLLSGITGIGKALMLFFSGEWGESVEVGKNAILDLMGTTAGAEAGQQFAEGFNDSVAAGTEKHQAYEAARKKEKEGSSLSINEYLNTDATKLSYENDSDDKEGKKGKKSRENSLSIAGGRGAANITMTINNYFNVASGTNIRQLADQVAGAVSDRLQDAIIGM